MEPTAIDAHHDLCAGFPKATHDWMEIWAQLLGINMGHDLREDFGGPIRDGANATQQDPMGDAAPGALLSPRVACAGCLTCALTLAQRTYREADTLGGAPPARAGQGKAPQDCCVFIE